MHTNSLNSRASLPGGHKTFASRFDNFYWIMHTFFDLVIVGFSKVRSSLMINEVLLGQCDSQHIVTRRTLRPFPATKVFPFIRTLRESTFEQDPSPRTSYPIFLQRLTRPSGWPRKSFAFIKRHLFQPTSHFLVSYLFENIMITMNDDIIHFLMSFHHTKNS